MVAVGSFQYRVVLPSLRLGEVTEKPEQFGFFVGATGWRQFADIYENR